MNPLNLNEVVEYVEQHIGKFHVQRISSLSTLKLRKVLQRKNPYLFRAKHLLTNQEIVQSLVDAHISSNEETIFGDWLEGLAIFINKKVYGGWKSGIPGIDLEFDHDNHRYIVNIKSGPNWANKSQKDKMLSEFADAKRTLVTSKSGLNVVAVNGCCYGKDKKPHKFPAKGTDYLKLCGQDFWEFISGNQDLYVDIIEPLGHKAKQINEEFNIAYVKMINNFTAEFMLGFCNDDGSIDWEKLVEFNSGRH